MEIGKKYEITFPSGDVTTIKVLGETHGSYKFEYLKNENRKHITPVSENFFYFPLCYKDLLKTKELE